MGFQANPFALMARAAVFALSSRWEGLSLVLIEALACGCRIVSTDCRTGPTEVLEGGRYGRLVPVGDPAAMGRAILEALDGDGDSEACRRRAGEFGAREIGARYLSLLQEVARTAREPS
jgi:glycosyltransferase involved in cell wall biosynthesis